MSSWELGRTKLSSDIEAGIVILSGTEEGVGLLVAKLDTVGLRVGEDEGLIVIGCCEGNDERLNVIGCCDGDADGLEVTGFWVGDEEGLLVGS
eukprot:scaffold297595_cov142-Cyclotella_meneghiniana.AAC.2